jgi:hypothetical protein
MPKLKNKWKKKIERKQREIIVSIWYMYVNIDIW